MLFSNEIAHKATKQFIVNAEEKALTYFARNFDLQTWNAKAYVNQEGKIVIEIPVEYPIFTEEPDPEYPDEEPEYVDYFDTWEEAEADNKLTLEYLEKEWLIQEDSSNPDISKNFDWSNKYVSSDINDMSIIVTPKEADEDEWGDKVTFQNGFVFEASDSFYLVDKLETPSGIFNVFLSTHID